MRKKRPRSILPPIASLSLSTAEGVAPAAVAYRIVRSQGEDPVLGGGQAGALRRSVLSAITRESADQLFLRRDGAALQLTRAGADLAVYQIGFRPDPLGPFVLPADRLVRDRISEIASACGQARQVLLPDLALRVVEPLVGADCPPRSPADLEAVQAAVLRGVTLLQHCRGVAVRHDRGRVVIGGEADQGPPLVLGALSSSPSGLSSVEVRGVLSAAGLPGRDPDALVRALRRLPGEAWVARPNPRSPLWVLTDAGRAAVASVREVVEVVEVPQNATAKWLADHMGQLYPLLLRRIRQRCQLSHLVGQTMDHVQEYLRRAIQRDSLRARIEEGRPIPLSQVALFALRSAHNDIRNSGSEPVCRELFGARTEREVRSGDGPERDHTSWQRSAKQRGVRAEEGSVVDITDLNGSPSDGGTLDDTVAFRQIWTRLESQVRESFDPGEIDLILSFLRERIQGSSIAETAESLRIDPHRAQRLHRRLRSELGGLVRSLTA